MASRRPRLHEVEAVRVLLQVRSATEAARLLGISQPAVSKALRQAEHALGFSLFERIAGRLHPTPEALQLVPALEGLFASLASLSDAGRAIRERNGGPVSVAAIPTLATVVVPAVVQALTRRSKLMRVSVEILPTRQIVEAVSKGLVEVGLVHDTVDDPLFRAQRLGASGMVCAVPPDHALAGRAGVELAELAQHPFVSYGVKSPIGDRLRAAFSAAGADYDPVVQIGASTSVCGIAVQSGLAGLVEEYVLSVGWWPTLSSVPLRPVIPLRPRLVTTTQRPLSLAAKAFCDECRRVTGPLLRDRRALS